MISFRANLGAIFFGVVFIFLPFFCFAQANDNFIINQQVGFDTIPPTIPGNFSVTPVTSSQIDLDWDASSDNIAVAGYQVFRDASQIATTTLTSYSDTGLTPSTTYSYYVTAFDAALNISTSTATLATTTFAAAATSSPTTTPNTSSPIGYRDIRLLDSAYDIFNSFIDFSFSTNVYTQLAVRWGRTADYELGYITSSIYKHDHLTRVDGLTPGTVYEIEVTFTDRSFRNTLVKTYTVTTRSSVDGESPPNVSNFSARRELAGVSLTWTNPQVDDFSHVRVLSSDRFYPTHTADGWLVYDGPGESVFDDRFTNDDTKRYYTIFVYDQAGNISSGAVAAIFGRKSSPTNITGSGEEIEPAQQSDSRVATSTTKKPEINDRGSWFKFSDIEFSQQGKLVPVIDGAVNLEQNKEVLVSIPYELLPEHLKTVVIDFTHPKESTQSFSLLLRINPNKTAYEARFITDIETGYYPIKVSLFDYATKELYEETGGMFIKRSAFREFTDFDADAMMFGNLIKYGSFLGILLILVWLWYLIVMRRRRERQF